MNSLLEFREVCRRLGVSEYVVQDGERDLLKKVLAVRHKLSNKQAGRFQRQKFRFWDSVRNYFGSHVMLAVQRLGMSECEVREMVLGHWRSQKDQRSDEVRRALALVASLRR